MTGRNSGSVLDNPASTKIRQAAAVALVIQGLPSGRLLPLTSGQRQRLGRYAAALFAKHLQWMALNYGSANCLRFDKLGCCNLP